MALHLAHLWTYLDLAESLGDCIGMYDSRMMLLISLHPKISTIVDQGVLSHEKQCTRGIWASCGLHM